MPHWLPGIFSLLVAITGWYYLFYSRLVHRLGAIENQRANLIRRRLRQVGGLVMLVLSGFFYAGFYTVDSRVNARAFVLVWLTVFALLLVIMLLALVDLKLTHRLRRRP